MDPPSTVFLVVVFYHICFSQDHLILILTCFNLHMNEQVRASCAISLGPGIPTARERKGATNAAPNRNLSLLSISNQVTELLLQKTKPCYVAEEANSHQGKL